MAEFGGKGNVNTIIEAMRDVFVAERFGEFKMPWYFPSINEYARLLDESGFEILYIELKPRLTHIDDVANWLEVFASGVVSHLNNKNRETFKQEVKKMLHSSKLYKDSKWYADYVRIRFKVKKRD